MGTGEISALIRRIGDAEKDLVGRIAAWSDINSGSYNAAGVTCMAALLYSELYRLTPRTCLFSIPDYEEFRDDGTIVRTPLGSGVRAICRPEAPVQVLLNGHLDTVFGPEHPFQKARREGARLIGPGVADMKGGLVVLVESLRILERASFRNRIGWEVILNPDEELGSPGSAELLAEAASRHHIGLVFEIAFQDGSLVSSRLGSGNFFVQAKGRPAHAGRDFESGRSAIAAIAEFLVELEPLNEERGIIVNVGRIAGGGAANIVPAHASCRLNVRVDSVESEARVERAIERIVAEIEKRREVRIEVHGSFARPPKPLAPGVEKMLADLRDCANESGFDLGWKPSGGGSDGNNLLASGLPAVDSLGVRGGGVHTAEEFLEIESVAERITLTARYLLKLACGDISPPER